MGKRIILGSASPRRRELLAQIGVEFEVRVSGKKETYHSREPERIVQELALMKAENVASELWEEQAAVAAETDRNSTLIIGADTVVVLDGRILGKPADEEEAFRMLSGLRGRSHKVFTGVAVLEYHCGERKDTVVCASETTVYVNEMTDEEIRAYIRTGEPMDKAGAYGIQGRFAAYIDRISGDYYNVVGLPVSCLYRILKEKDAV